jgi:23S rRNA (uracil1939-C5)-methyltransferase
MGTLGDGIAQGSATRRQMRTAPLWGVRTRALLLHDGRATSLDAAIVAHDGQGKEASDRFLRLSPGAFMQTNSEMSQVLYRHAIEQARLRPGDVAWDLYCGAGAIGLLAAPYVERVIGVEISSESIARARENAALNGVANAEFVEGDVAKQLRPLLERVPRPSVVFVDPPRAGLTPRAVRRVLELAPERISYVSCNPTTLAPNARQLVDGGYRLELVQPVDMFPHTHHIECVAQLTAD